MSVVTTYRTTEAKVRGVINFDSAIEDLIPFIAAANELVTELCVPVGYSAGRLAIIETWLAAHFLAIRDPRYSSETMGAASASYQQMTGLNLGLTPYGQQALLLDSAGKLATLNFHKSQGKNSRVGIMYLGTCRPLAQGRQWRFYDLPCGING